MSAAVAPETTASWTWLDAVWIIVISALLLRGFLRGFVQELVEVAVLALAAYAGARLYRPVADWLLQWAPALPPQAAMAIGFGAAAGAVLLAGAVLTGMLVHLARGSPLSWADSVGGALLGAAKGVAVVAALVVLVAGLPPGDLRDELSDSVISRRVRLLVPQLWEDVRQAFPGILPALPTLSDPAIDEEPAARTAI